MKLNIMKKLVAIFLCLLVAFGSLVSIKSFADLKDIEFQGGCYMFMCDVKRRYKEQHPEDKTEYDCHHLISKKALNLWAEEIKRRGLANDDNWFLTGDEDQKWAPSIIMEKADHEKTLSYYDIEETESFWQNRHALNYIYTQANRIIYNGDILGVLQCECDFIRYTFGNKYDKALVQVWNVIKYLDFSYQGWYCLTMRDPYNTGLVFTYDFSPSRFARA